MTACLSFRDNSSESRFEADFADGSIGIAQYHLDGDTITFTHTAVPPAHEGQGVGSALVHFALKSARARGLKVVPLCPFVAAFMRKHPEEQDLLDPEFRSRRGLD